MATASEYAKNATAALHQILHISPGDFDEEGTAAVIEQAIRNATRERESRARRQLKDAQATAQERLARLLRSSPAVIYSYKATGDFAPTFVSENIRSVLGYEPQEYLDNGVFWRRCVHPDDLAAVEAESAHLYKKNRNTVVYRFLKKDGTYCWVNDEQRLIRDRDDQPAEVVGSWSDITDRKRAEEAAAAARGSCRALAQEFASGHLQLQSHRRLRTDVHQSQREGPARV